MEIGLERLRLSAWDFAQHDFHRALKILRREKSSIALIESLHAGINKNIKDLSKAAFTLLILTILINHSTSDDGDLFYGQYIFFSIFDKNILFLIVSFLFVYIWNCVMSVFVLNRFFTIVLVKNYNNDISHSSVSSIIDGGNAFLSGLLPQYRFFYRKKYVSIPYFVILLFMFIPIFFFIINIFLAYRTVLHSTIENFEINIDTLIFLTSNILILYPFLFSYIYFKKFIYNKNKNYIRWIFLRKVYRSSNYNEENINRWLGNRDRK